MTTALTAFNKGQAIETAKETVTVTLRQNHAAAERSIKSTVESALNELNGLKKVTTITDGKKRTSFVNVEKPDAIRTFELQKLLTHLTLTGNNPKDWTAPIRFDVPTEGLTQGDLSDKIIKFLLMGSLAKNDGFQIAATINFSRKVVLEVDGRFVNLGKLAVGTNWLAVRKAVNRAIAGKFVEIGESLDDATLAEISTGIKPAEGLQLDKIEDQVIEALAMAQERKRELSKLRKEAKEAQKAIEAPEEM